MLRSLFQQANPAEALAARIAYKIDELAGFGKQISKRQIERRMNANKYPHWAEAWKILVGRGCIQLSKGKNRQQLVRLVSVPKDLQTTTIIMRPRKRRPQTPWFKKRLPEFLRRDGYDGRADKIEAEEEEGYGVPRYVPSDPLGW